MTPEIMMGITLAFLITITVLNILLLRKIASMSQEQLGGKLDSYEKSLDRIEKSVKEQIAQNREETSASARQSRDEISKTLLGFNESLVKSITEFASMQKNQLDTFSTNLSAIGNSIDQRSINTQMIVENQLRDFQKNMAADLEKIRGDVTKSMETVNNSVVTAIKEMNNSNNNFLETIRSQIQRLTDSNRENFENIRNTIEIKLAQMQEENSNKLTEIRQEMVSESRKTREDSNKSLKDFNDSITMTMKNVNEVQNSHLKNFAENLSNLTLKNEERLENLRKTIENKLSQIQTENTMKMMEIRKESAENSKQIREDMSASMKDFSAQVDKTLVSMIQSQKQSFDSIFKYINDMIETNNKRAEQLREVIENKLSCIQEDNTKKLDEMRKTVDEKLQSTLEKRLGESFNIVSERLELVHKGLGEMQVLASGVGDLKKVLTNVKTRGTWGEIQLGNLLEQILAPDQYDKNVKTKEGSGEIVEYAIKLPGRDLKDDEIVWLPIDAKFPQEQYIRLVEASEACDAAGVESASKQLESSVRSCAKDISEKYLNPPKTTDFAILFLPVEGLYAEVLRRSGLSEQIQRDYRVVIAGPTTLSALLNSLQMGFRTLAIEKRSSEVWNVLSAVKTEFNKFGVVISKVHKKIVSAGDEISKISTRTRAIDRKLREVETLPAAESQSILELTDGSHNPEYDTQLETESDFI